MVGNPPPQHLRETPPAREAATPSRACPAIAVVGSGPAGCYAAQFLAKKWPDSEITVFESLPAPYGLIRYGVAADHQGTKGVSRQFDRLFTRDGVRFAGNVTIGRDIAFDRLAESFDIIVLATGLPGDRGLAVPCEQGARVVGAGALLRALNGFPQDVLPRDEEGRCVPLGRRVVVVGMGNVALDVLRLLSKKDFTGSDIHDELLGRIRPAPPETIDVLARSRASQSKCDAAMLRELIALADVDVAVSGLTGTDEGPVVDLLREFAGPAGPQDVPGRTQVTFHFGLVPESITARGGATVLAARRPDDGGPPAEFAADTVVTAIGFTQGEACPRQDWAGDHVYRVGWLRRGARGTIAQNRKDAQAVVRSIVDDFEAGRIGTAGPGFRAVEGSLAERVVGFPDWQRIDDVERRAAPPGRCRRKITEIEQMLAIAMGHNRKDVA